MRTIEEVKKEQDQALLELGVFIIKADQAKVKVNALVLEASQIQAKMKMEEEKPGGM